MKAIYWDTSTEWIIIEIFEIEIDESGDPSSKPTSRVIYSFKEYLPRVASTGLVSLIQEAMAKANISKPDWIFVAKGPGSFTGIRIAVATARNLSQLWEIPCMGIDTLGIYANYFAGRFPHDKIAIVLDGKMSKYFVHFVESEPEKISSVPKEMLQTTLDLKWEEIEPLLTKDWKVFSHTEIPIPHIQFKEDYPGLTGIPIESYWNHDFINQAKETHQFHYETLLPKYMRETYATKPIPKS
ncbi:MAG: tRNA (adenosine(37)-N6)-threonylcarbamoyltransferase complex dimerization subunit type 1 TsaB [Leptospira sp.]|nr:tRNA (adenosine(37)-N6)-threonylcarbamoyltransferase complex dimerization subunit type 1 TsaB [Leptospira sp.]